MWQFLMDSLASMVGELMAAGIMWFFKKKP